MANKKVRVKKSEALTKDEYRMFEKFVFSKETKTDAAEILNVSRPTLDRLLLAGSGRPETIKRIKDIIAA